MTHCFDKERSKLGGKQYASFPDEKAWGGGDSTHIGFSAKCMITCPLSSPLARSEYRDFLIFDRF